VSGSLGSYVTTHLCHMCAREIYILVDETSQTERFRTESARQKGWKDFMKLDPNSKCWRCSGLPRPSPEDPAYVYDANGAGLCQACVVTPAVPVPSRSLAAIKSSFNIFHRDNKNKVIPVIYTPIQLGYLGSSLLRISATTRAFAFIFTPVKALAELYEHLLAALWEGATYAPRDVEDHGMMRGCKTLALSLSNTNDIRGLLRHFILMRTHPVLGPAIASDRVIMLSDAKIYKAIERETFATNADMPAIHRVLTRGRVDILDIGLHVVSKCSEHIISTYDCILDKYFGIVVRHAGGKGHFFSKMRLSTRLVLLSASYQAYTFHADLLNREFNKYPADPALNALMALHEWHIPLLIYYLQCIKLGRDTDVRVRRDAFDIWLTFLAPLMIVSIRQLGSAEYSKDLMQFHSKVLWWKEHVPDLFQTIRDNFGFMMDSESIELIHSWVANNCKNVNLKHSNSAQIQRAFLGRFCIQTFKSSLAGILGVPVSRGSKGKIATEQFDKVCACCGY